MTGKFIFDRLMSLVATDSSENIKYYVNDGSNLHLAADGNDVTVTDSLGNAIATIARGKTNCTFTFDTKVFDFYLFAEQIGAEVEIATADSPLVLPKLETIEINSTNATAVVLDKNVVDSGSSTYEIAVSEYDGGGNLVKSYTQGAATAEGVFTYTSNTKTLAFAEGDTTVGNILVIRYDYTATSNAMMITESVNNAPDARRVTALIKGYEVCDQTTAKFVYLDLANAKLATTYDVGMNPDETISVTLNCAVSYCATDRKFYTLSTAE